MPVAAWMEFPLTSTRMKEAISPNSSTSPTARYTVRLGKASRGESDWSTALPLAPPRAAETRAAATPATSQVARAAIGRLESRRSTRYQCPSSSPSMVAPRNRDPVSRASAPRAGRPLSWARGQPATSPGTTAAIPAQRAAGTRAYSSACQMSTAAANSPSQRAAMRPVAPAAASSSRPASQASAAQARAVPPASLKNPGRTTPQSGASQSRASPPSAVSYRTTVSTPAGPCTCSESLLPGLPWQGSASVSPEAAEPALRVDDLPGDPGPVVGAEPGDQSRRVVGGAPAAGREQAGHPRVDRRVGVAGVGGAGVHRVHGDGLIGQGVGQAEGDPGQGGLGGRVGQLALHGPELLPGGEQHHPAPRAPVVPGGEPLDEQQRGLGVDGEAGVQLGRGDRFQPAGTAPGVIADQHIDMAERFRSGRQHPVGRLRVEEVGLQVLDPGRSAGAQLGQDRVHAAGVG